MLFDNTIQLTRYSVTPIKDVDKTSIIKDIEIKLDNNKIYDIDGEPDEIAVGWSDFENIFETNLNNFWFDLEDHNDIIKISMRFDEKKINKNILKKEINEKIKEIEQDGYEANKVQKKEIKEQISDILFIKAKAEPKGFNVIWKPYKGKIYFFSTNKKANDAFIRLFHSTFETTISPIIPFELALENNEFCDIENISPCLFNKAN